MDLNLLIITILRDKGPLQLKDVHAEVIKELPGLTVPQVKQALVNLARMNSLVWKRKPATCYMVFGLSGAA